MRPTSGTSCPGILDPTARWCTQCASQMLYNSSGSKCTRRSSMTCLCHGMSWCVAWANSGVSRSACEKRGTANAQCPIPPLPILTKMRSSRRSLQSLRSFAKKTLRKSQQSMYLKLEIVCSRSLLWRQRSGPRLLLALAASRSRPAPTAYWRQSSQSFPTATFWVRSRGVSKSAPPEHEVVGEEELALVHSSEVLKRHRLRWSRISFALRQACRRSPFSGLRR